MAVSGKKSFRKVLFMELAGFLSLFVTVAVIAFVVAIHTIPWSVMALPLAGLLFTMVYVVLTIGYMRKDLHRIHELHGKKIYALGRFLVYLVGIGMIGWAIVNFIQTKEFWSEIDAVVISVVSLITGVFAIYYTLTLGYLIQHEHLRHSGVSVWDLVIVAIFPVGLVAWAVFNMFSLKAATTTEGETDFKMPVPKIIEAFEASADSAAVRFVGKTFEFGGTVTEVAGDSAVLLKLASGVDEFTVNCGFDKSQYEKVRFIAAGDSVEVKCSCSGITAPDDEMSLLSEKSLDMVRCSLQNLTKAKP